MLQRSVWAISDNEPQQELCGAVATPTPVGNGSKEQENAFGIVYCNFVAGHELLYQYALKKVLTKRTGGMRRRVLSASVSRG